MAMLSDSWLLYSVVVGGRLCPEKRTIRSDFHDGLGGLLTYSENKETDSECQEMVYDDDVLNIDHDIQIMADGTVYLLII
jgi:hypothetical protein